VCDKHYQQFLRTDGCRVENCSKVARIEGYCPEHHRTYGEYGPAGRGSKWHGVTGEGKGYIDKDGYRVLYQPNHPNARKGGKIFEHTLVMSNKLKRPLFDNEYVVHKNDVKDDNRADNLQLCAVAIPPSHRVEDLVAFAKETLIRYEKLTDAEPELVY
jgi:hypothetical protein